MGFTRLQLNDQGLEDRQGPIQATSSIDHVQQRASDATRYPRWL
jgi:hypothetical protein